MPSYKTHTLQVDLPVLLSKYYGKKPKNKGLTTFLNVEEDDDVPLTDILHEKSKRYIYIVDPYKSKIKLWITMIDFCNGERLPLSTNKLCWNCKHGFPYHPLGCPTKYYNDKSVFETEGIFCSFPCIKRYILENSLNTRYKKSSTLMSLMHQKIFGFLADIPSAPSWKTLTVFGGHLSIEQYRSSFGKISYVETNMMKRPLLYNTGLYIKEKQVNGNSVYAQTSNS